MKKRRTIGMAIAAAALVGSFLVAGSSAVAGEIDVRDTAPARAAAEILKQLARGNEGSAGWESLTLNQEARTIRGTAYVRCRHVVILRSPFGTIKIVVYDWTVKAHVKLDLRGGNSEAVIDFGRGIKVKARHLIAALSAL